MTSKKLESSVEKPAVKYAKSLGVDCSKVKFINRNGASDRLFIDNGAIVYFIEFKRPKGGTTAALQKVFARDMEKKGINVYLGVNDLEDAKMIIRHHHFELPSEFRRYRCPGMEKYAVS